MRSIHYYTKIIEPRRVIIYPKTAPLLQYGYVLFLLPFKSYSIVRDDVLFQIVYYKSIHLINVKYNPKNFTGTISVMGGGGV